MGTVRPLRSTDPRQLGGYRLMSRLGEGGQGVVFLGKAHDQQEVAIKLLKASPTEVPEVHKYLARELAAARKVDPRWTAEILDSEIQGDTAYIVSEYIQGPSLHEVIGQTGPMRGADLHGVVVGMAGALMAIHQAAVVHRDFKPSNVLLGPDGPSVIDFGIARILDATTTSTGLIVGTPAYMAPEQICGERAGQPSDVFAWACTVGYAANGYPPFGNDDIPAIITRILYEDPDLGRLDAALRDLVAACLSKTPTQRPSAHEIVGSLIAEPTEKSSTP